MEKYKLKGEDMELKSKIIKYGNSQGITIPNKIAKLIGLNVGDELIICVNEDNIITIKRN